MNRIAQQLKEKNIAEYLIYMWQEEDLIRANHCELEEMEEHVIARYPEEQRPAMREWYGNLITMMSEEGVREKGHLQINKNVIINLTELHNALSSSPKFPFYSAAYFKALPFIVELRMKNGKRSSIVPSTASRRLSMSAMRERTTSTLSGSECSSMSATKRDMCVPFLSAGSDTVISTVATVARVSSLVSTVMGTVMPRTPTRSMAILRPSRAD